MESVQLSTGHGISLEDAIRRATQIGTIPRSDDRPGEIAIRPRPNDIRPS